MKKLTVILSFLLMTPAVFGQDVIGVVITDNVVLDEMWLPQLGDVEPLFGRQKAERDVASLKKENVKFAEWSGQLSVLKEIPYSYPQMTRRSLAAKVLAEMEKESN